MNQNQIDLEVAVEMLKAAMHKLTMIQFTVGAAAADSIETPRKGRQTAQPAKPVASAEPARPAARRRGGPKRGQGYSPRELGVYRKTHAGASADELIAAKAAGWSIKGSKSNGGVTAVTAS